MSFQDQSHPSTKVVIFGISGTGKSTLLEKLIRRENAKWIFLFDHKDGDLSRRFKTRACYTKEELDAATERGGIIIFNPARLYPGKPDVGFAFLCKYVWRVKGVLKGKKILATDELDALVDARNEPEDLCMILDQGRTFKLDCFFIAQAANGIHNQVRKQLREIFVMMQGDKNGTDWLEEKGFDKSQIQGLKNGEWLYKNLNTGTSAQGGKAFTPKNSERNLKGL